MKGFESDREGSREPFIKQSYMKLKTGAKKEKKTKRKMATSALFNVIISWKDKAVLETLNTPCRIFLPSREVSKQRGSQK